MASTPMMRTASQGDTDLRHPMPGLQALQGAYASNIDRLEESAERLSTSTNMEDEIRRLHLELKREDSRRSSIRQSSLAAREAALREAADETRTHSAMLSLSRKHSTSSFANSILDVCSAARCGGYSPGGFVQSPVTSLSGTWSLPPSNPSAPFYPPHRSWSKASWPTTPLDDLPELGFGTMYTNGGRTNQRTSSKRSFSDSNGIHNASHRTGENPRSMRILVHSDDGERNPSFIQSPVDINTRPPSAASGDTFQQAQHAFLDFDGVHFAPSIRESLRKPSYASLRSGSSGTRLSSMMLSPTEETAPRLPPPPPADNTAYYPAPVPRTLNIPKRLSQMPSPTVQAKRKGQMLEGLNSEARKSAAWLPASEYSLSSPDLLANRPKSMLDPGRSMMSLNNLSQHSLPPQLRASIFFEHRPVTQELEIKNESAVATLENLLNEGANAPVNVFTDHPFAGALGGNIYGKTIPHGSTTTLSSGGKKAQRSSPGLRPSTSAGNLLDPNSRVRLSRSPPALSVSDADEPIDGTSRSAPMSPVIDGPNSEGIPEEEEIEGEDVQNMFEAPTTLLAELQIRKHQQRSRNRTAATAFPNGMHSTLLELDAVAEVEKKQRKGHRVALAWEDPIMVAAEKAAVDDDDVPLGLLFSANKNGELQKNRAAGLSTAELNRPIGLLEKREMEENEPLSKRRTRLLGIDPRLASRPSQQSLGSYRQSFMPAAEDTSGQGDIQNDEGETLAQRIRRLKSKAQLDLAVDDVIDRPASKEFETELLSQFGIPTSTDRPKASPLPSPALSNNNNVDVPPSLIPSRHNTPKIIIETEDEAEETLGQRRARLQAQQSLQPQPPPLKQRRSMADILSAAPLNPGASQTNPINNNSLLSLLPQTSLLAQNEARTTKHKSFMYERNIRSSSYGLDKPLVSVPAPADKYKGLKRSGGFAGGALNDGMGGSLPLAPGVAYGGLQQMAGARNVMGMSGNGAYGIGQVGMPMAYGMPMAFTYPAAFEQTERRQRDMIDQWRQSVVP